MFSDLVIGQLILAATARNNIVERHTSCRCPVDSRPQSGCFTHFGDSQAEPPDPVNGTELWQVFRLVTHRCWNNQKQYFIEVCHCLSPPVSDQGCDCPPGWQVS